jgi:hypothetical protein
MIKDFLGLGLGVSQLIIGIIALQTLCIFLFLIFLHRGMILILQKGLMELDNKPIPDQEIMIKDAKGKFKGA